MSTTTKAYEPDAYDIYAKKRIEEIRIELRNERVSYKELAELKEFCEYIRDDDIELLEAIGMLEF